MLPTKSSTLFGEQELEEFITIHDWIKAEDKLSGKATSVCCCKALNRTEEVFSCPHREHVQASDNLFHPTAIHNINTFSVLNFIYGFSVFLVILPPSPPSTFSRAHPERFNLKGNLIFVILHLVHPFRAIQSNKKSFQLWLLPFYRLPAG